ncbi:MAG: hypothetical protein EPGJADBJ_00247 [Saprospiraceae bacterium]|nr:hypothetical protein [Saprospiraceae bacterium]
MTKHLLFFCLTQLIVQAMIAQTPNTCPDNTPGADECVDACIYCNLESYTGSTAGYTDGSVSSFCGTLENEQWLGFVAGGSSITITVMPFGCALGDGVQVALYPACNLDPIACNGGMADGGSTPVSVSAGTIPGQVYYLMVDGYAGDLCNFTLDVSPAGAAIGIQFEAQTIGLCPNETFTLNGVPYSAPAVVKDTLYSNSGGCDTIVTYNLAPLPYVEAAKTIEFCPGDTIILDGIIFTEPGTYVSDVPLPATGSGCDSIITYTLEHLPQPTTSSIVVLQTGEPFTIGGNTYFAPDTVQALLPAPAGCDTLATYWLLLDQSIPDTCSETRRFFKLLGEQANFERGNVLIPAADGNFYIAGEKDVQSLLMKVTPEGEVLWSRSFQPVPTLTTHITDLVEDSEGMLAGSAIAGEGDINLKSYAFRYNPLTDNIIWSRLLEQQSPEAFAILEKNPGGNFLLLTSPQLALNVDDAEIWELNRNTGALVGSLTDRYNLGISDVWNSMIMHDGALYVTGRHIHINQPAPAPLDKIRMGLSKLDLATGAPIWSRLSHIDTSASATLFGQDLLVHDDALLTVYSGNDSDDPDATPALFLQKNALDGDLLWVKRYDTPLPAGILASDIQQMSDGYIIIGLAFQNAAWQKVIIKTDFNGDVLWARQVSNTSPSNIAGAFSLGQHQSAVVNDVLFLTTATADTPTDAVLIKMTSDGEAGDSCGLVTPFDVVAETVSDPVNTVVQIPFNQFIGQSSGVQVAVQTASMPVATYCISCVQVCDDTLDLGPDIVLCQDSTLTFNAGSGFVSYLWQDGSSDSTFTTDEAGIYWVEVTDACGDKQRDSVLLTFSLVSDIKLKDTTLCLGGSLTLSVPGFDTYDWSPSAGLDCDSCATVVIQPAVTTIYTLYAENAAGCTKADTFTVVVLPFQTRSETVEFCPGESVVIGGVEYTQSGTVVDTIPGTVGCDTIVTYTLTLLPYNLGAQAIEFCPGESVTIGGVEYTQSATVVDTIPGTIGCDTIITYTLTLLPQPTRSETIEFCSGESVTIGGNVYTQPGTVMDTITAAVGCDTIVTYTLQFIDTPGSSVSIDCPTDLDIPIDPGAGPVAVNYNLPTVSSDCECPGIALTLTQGLAPGGLFPTGPTAVCYQAKDSCGNTASCCFEVFVREEEPCDVKTIGCMKYELLDITRSASSLNLNYRIRVTNTCANKMIYTAIQIPDGMAAVEPANNSVFTAGSGRQYDVRNPNYSPFYSIRFKSKLDSIANGQSDIFEYTLPPQINPAYIHLTSRLYSQVFYEAHLNTFNCPIEIVQDKPQNRNLATPGSPSDIRLFPNPTSGALFADFSDWQGEQLKVQVFNSQGQRVQLFGIRAGDAPQRIELPEGLSAGLYFLDVLRENGEKQVARFVMQR